MGQELMGRKDKLTFSALPSQYPPPPCHIPTEFHAFGIVHIVKMKIKTVILGWFRHIYNLSPSFIVKKNNWGNAA
jgi:hypothetical protein